MEYAMETAQGVEPRNWEEYFVMIGDFARAKERREVRIARESESHNEDERDPGAGERPQDRRRIAV